MSRAVLEQDGPDVLLSVRVQPRASRNELLRRPDGLALRLTAPPVEGAANAACIAYLADRLGCPRSAISIAQGAKSRTKQLRIRNATLAHVRTQLGLDG